MQNKPHPVLGMVPTLLHQGTTTSILEDGMQVQRCMNVLYGLKTSSKVISRM